MGEPGANVVAYLSLLLAFASAILALPIYVEQALATRMDQLRTELTNRGEEFFNQISRGESPFVDDLRVKFDNAANQVLPRSTYRARYLLALIIMVLLAVLIWFMIYDLYGIGDVILIEQIILLIAMSLVWVAVDAGKSYYRAVREIQQYDYTVQVIMSDMDFVMKRVQFGEGGFKPR